MVVFRMADMRPGFGCDLHDIRLPVLRVTARSLNRAPGGVWSVFFFKNTGAIWLGLAHRLRYLLPIRQPGHRGETPIGKNRRPGQTIPTWRGAGSGVDDTICQSGSAMTGATAGCGRLTSRLAPEMAKPSPPRRLWS